MLNADAAFAIEAQAREFAESVLDQFWDSDQFPVDPYAIARRMGIEPYEGQIRQPDVSGILRSKPGQDPEIVVDIDDNPRRRRFTCAHEIGHYVKSSSERGQGKRDHDIAHIDYRTPKAATGEDPGEVFANKFAAHLLMPEYAVRALHESGASLFEMTRFFNVSPGAMSFRLRNLGIASDV